MANKKTNEIKPLPSDIVNIEKASKELTEYRKGKNFEEAKKEVLKISETCLGLENKIEGLITDLEGQKGTKTKVDQLKKLKDSLKEMREIALEFTASNGKDVFKIEKKLRDNFKNIKDKISKIKISVDNFDYTKTEREQMEKIKQVLEGDYDEKLGKAVKNLLNDWNKVDSTDYFNNEDQIKEAYKQAKEKQVQEVAVEPVTTTKSTTIPEKLKENPVIPEKKKSFDRNGALSSILDYMDTKDFKKQSKKVRDELGDIQMMLEANNIALLKKYIQNENLEKGTDDIFRGDKNFAWVFELITEDEENKSVDNKEQKGTETAPLDNTLSKELKDNVGKGEAEKREFSDEEKKQLGNIKKVLGKDYKDKIGILVKNKIDEWNKIDSADYFDNENKIWDAYEQVKNQKETTREESVVDMPVSLISELLKNSGKEAAILENIFEEQGNVSKEIIKGLFDKLSSEQEKVLKEVLEKSGRNLEDFVKQWKESGWGEVILETIKQKIETTCKNEAAEKIGTWDRFKADWKKNLIKVGIIGGTALLAGIAAPAGLVAAGVLAAGSTTGAAIGAGIAGGGFIGRVVNKIFKNKEEKARKDRNDIIGDNSYETEAQQNLAETQEKYFSQVKGNFEKDLKASGMDLSDYFGSLISQSIVEKTSKNGNEANTEVLRRHILEMFKKEGNIEGEQKAQLEELLVVLSDRRTMTELSKSEDPKIIKYLKILSETKSGSLFMNEADSSKTKEALGYLAPLLLGGAVGTACQMSGAGAVSTAIRSGLLGAAGAYMGYRLGEAADMKDRRNEVIKELKNKVQEVENVLKKYRQGAKIEKDNLKVDVENLAAMVQTGVLEKDPVLITRTEALIREGRKVFFEGMKEKTEANNMAEFIAGIRNHTESVHSRGKKIIEDITNKSSKKRGTKKIIYSIFGAVAGAAGMYSYLDNQEQIKEAIGQAYTGTKEYLGFETQKSPVGAVETAAVASRVQEGVEPTEVETQVEIPQELKKVYSGDSFEKIFKRQILDDPKRFGYEDGKNLGKFVSDKAQEFLQKNNLWENGRGKGLQYNPKAEITLNDDGTWKGNEYVKTYNMEMPKPKVEMVEEISDKQVFDEAEMKIAENQMEINAAERIKMDANYLRAVNRIKADFGADQAQRLVGKMNVVYNKLNNLEELAAKHPVEGSDNLAGRIKDLKESFLKAQTDVTPSNYGNTVRTVDDIGKIVDTDIKIIQNQTGEKIGEEALKTIERNDMKYGSGTTKEIRTEEMEAPRVEQTSGEYNREIGDTFDNKGNYYEAFSKGDKAVFKNSFGILYDRGGNRVGFAGKDGAFHFHDPADGYPEDSLEKVGVIRNKYEGQGRIKDFSEYKSPLAQENTPSQGSKDTLASDVAELSKKSGLSGDKLAEGIMEYKVPTRAEVQDALQELAEKGDKTARNLLKQMDSDKINIRNSAQGRGSLYLKDHGYFKQTVDTKSVEDIIAKNDENLMAKTAELSQKATITEAQKLINDKILIDDPDKAAKYAMKLNRLKGEEQFKEALKILETENGTLHRKDALASLGVEEPRDSQEIINKIQEEADIKTMRGRELLEKERMAELKAEEDKIDRALAQEEIRSKANTLEWEQKRKLLDLERAQAQEEIEDMFKNMQRRYVDDPENLSKLSKQFSKNESALEQVKLDSKSSPEEVLAETAKSLEKGNLDLFKKLPHIKEAKSWAENYSGVGENKVQDALKNLNEAVKNTDSSEYLKAVKQIENLKNQIDKVEKAGLVGIMDREGIKEEILSKPISPEDKAKIDAIKQEAVGAEQRAKAKVAEYARQQEELQNIREEKIQRIKDETQATKARVLENKLALAEKQTEKIFKDAYNYLDEKQKEVDFARSVDAEKQSFNIQKEIKELEKFSKSLQRANEKGIPLGKEDANEFLTKLELLKRNTTNDQALEAIKDAEDYLKKGGKVERYMQMVEDAVSQVLRSSKK